MLKINPNISIYVQLAEYLRIEIFSGGLHPGDKIRSIREMAVELEVNPNTIKRVYQELIDDGLIFTNGTLGNYVTGDIIWIQQQKQRYILQKTKEYTNLLDTLDVNIEDILGRPKGDKHGTNH
jgi:GntR family transcriptional regulator